MFLPIALLRLLPDFDMKKAVCQQAYSKLYGVVWGGGFHSNFCSLTRSLQQ